MGREKSHKSERAKPPADHAERLARWQQGGWEEKSVYEEELPPPLSTVEVTTIVPVYNEFASGAFWDLLSGAVNQTASSHTFEIVLVVNNSFESAEERSEGYQDNQILLAVVRALRDATEHAGASSSSIARTCSRAFTQLAAVKISLSAWQRELFVAAVTKKIRLYAIDASSADRAAYREDDRMSPVHPTGIARHIGGRVAYRRYSHATGTDTGLIDFVDADCGFPPNYYEVLARAGRSDAEQGAFYKEIVTYAPHIPEWKGMEPLERIGHLFHFLRQNITHRRRLFMGSGLWWAPSPVVRASLFKSVGGYTYQAYIDEDFYFAHVIRSQTVPKVIEGTHVRLSDRASSRGADGKKWNSKSLPISRTSDEATFARFFDPSNLSILEGESARYQSFARSVLRYDERLQDNPRYRALRKKYWDREVKQSRQRAGMYRETLRALIPILRTTSLGPQDVLNPETYRAWLTKHFQKTLNHRTFDVLLQNPTVMASLITVCELMRDETKRAALGISESDLEDAVWSFFRKYLPEYCEVLPEQEPNYQLMRESVEIGTLPAGYSLRYLTHLLRAQADFKRLN